MSEGFLDTDVIVRFITGDEASNRPRPSPSFARSSPIATAERRGGGDLYSYDHDFDGLSGITRREP